MNLDRETIDMTDGPFYRSATDGRLYYHGEGPEFSSECPFCGSYDCRDYPDCEGEGDDE